MSSTKQLGLSMISSLIDAVLHALDDAITPAAYWVLELLDSKDNLQQATGEIVNADKIHIFQETVGTPFVALPKSIEVLLNHYGRDKFALTLNDEDSCHIPRGAHRMDNFSYFTS